MKNVKPIFFYDASLADTITDSVKEAFNYIRNNIQIAIYQNTDGEPPEAGFPKKTAENLKKKEMETIREVAQTSPVRNSKKALAIKLTDDEFSKLTSLRFFPGD